ncbi:MAG: hypothetical protein AAFR68_04080 [Pseudomonadota bacterium]
MDFHTIGTQIGSDKGVAMPVESPAGRPLYAVREGEAWKLTENSKAEGAIPSTLQVISTDSDLYRQRKERDLPALTMKDLKTGQSLTERDERRLITCSAGVVGMNGIVWKGQMLEYSEEAVLEFLHVYRQALDQVDVYIADRANFFAKA